MIWWLGGREREDRRSSTAGSLFHARQGSNGWVAASFGQGFTFTQAAAVVDLQELRRCFTDCGGRLETDALKLEVISPAISARVEQSDELRRLADKSAKIAPLVVIAAGASPRQVARLVGATVLKTDNMVHLAAPEGVILVDEAVLADVVGAVGDELPQPLVNLAAHEPGVAGRGPWPAA